MDSENVLALLTELTDIIKEKRVLPSKIISLPNIPRACPITDLAYLLNGNPNIIYTEKVRTDGSLLTYSKDGMPSNVAGQDGKGIIRPMLRIPKEVDLSSLKDNMRIEYGEYPQSLPEPDMQKILDREFSNYSNFFVVSKNLVKLDETFSIDCASVFSPYCDRVKPSELPVYQYEGKKYVRLPVVHDEYRGKVRVDDSSDSFVWVEVLPVVWKLDTVNRALISEKGLISNIPFMESFYEINNWGYEKNPVFSRTLIFRFLERYFLPDIMRTFEESMNLSQNSPKRK